MSEYAEKECVGCTRLAPGNEMHQVTEDVKVGHSSGRWSTGGSSGRSSRTSGGHTSYGSSSRSSSRYISGESYYQRQQNWYCAACYEARRLAIAARRKATLLVGLGLALIVAIAVVALSFADTSPSPAPSAEEAATLASLPEPPPPPMEAAVEENPFGPVPEEPVVSTEEPATTSASAPLPVVGVAEDSQQYRALLVSLETGEPARWSEPGGLEGFVSASEVTAYSDRRCRSFQYRVSYRGETNTSVPQMACQAPGQPWRVQP